MKPMHIAFIGYNTAQTLYFFKQFASLHRGEIEPLLPPFKNIRFHDGTTVRAVTRAGDYIGHGFDQVIIAVGRRGTTDWAEPQLDLYANILLRMTQRVPDGFRVLVYDLDSCQEGP